MAAQQECRERLAGVLEWLDSQADAEGPFFLGRQASGAATCFENTQLLAGSVCVKSLHSHRRAGSSVANKMQCTLPRMWAGALHVDLLTSRYMSTRADTCLREPIHA